MIKKRISLGIAAMFVLVATPAMARDLTVVSWGGAYSAAQKKHMIDPFFEATGINVLSEVYTGGLAEIRAQVEAGNILWDAVDISVIDLERACSDGLLEVIPHDILLAGDDGVPAKEDFFPAALANECGVGVIFWSVLFAYNTDTIQGGNPSTIADFFDTDKFPGKRALKKQPQVNLEWALVADGVPPSKVYELLATAQGQARAFAKLDSIKDDLVWFEFWADAPQLLNDGEAVMVQSANGRIYDDIKSYNRPFVMVWDNNVFDLDVWAIVKGSPNLKQALEFVKFATGTKPLSGLQDVAYAPTRKSSTALVDPAINKDLPTSHIDEGLKADGIFWADFGESLGEKFNEWLLK